MSRAKPIRAESSNPISFEKYYSWCDPNSSWQSGSRSSLLILILHHHYHHHQHRSGTGAVATEPSRYYYYYQSTKTNGSQRMNQHATTQYQPTTNTVNINIKHINKNIPRMTWRIGKKNNRKNNWNNNRKKTQRTRGWERGGRSNSQLLLWMIHSIHYHRQPTCPQKQLR